MRVAPGIQDEGAHTTRRRRQGALVTRCRTTDTPGGDAKLPCGHAVQIVDPRLPVVRGDQPGGCELDDEAGQARTDDGIRLPTTLICWQLVVARLCCQPGGCRVRCNGVVDSLKGCTFLRLQHQVGVLHQAVVLVQCPA
jgi:hypothetical protein